MTLVYRSTWPISHPSPRSYTLSRSLASSDQRPRRRRRPSRQHAIRSPPLLPPATAEAPPPATTRTQVPREARPPRFARATPPISRRPRCAHLPQERSRTPSEGRYGHGPAYQHQRRSPNLPAPVRLSVSGCNLSFFPLPPLLPIHPTTTTPVSARPSPLQRDPEIPPPAEAVRPFATGRQPPPSENATSTLRPPPYPSVLPACPPAPRRRHDQRPPDRPCHGRRRPVPPYHRTAPLGTVGSPRRQATRDGDGAGRRQNTGAEGGAGRQITR